MQFSQGSFRLFRLAGIDVFLHWSWLLVAFVEIQLRTNEYHSQAWNIAEYLTLFGIVLLHEFGHALACRQVGGSANRIVLWPLGGIAYVSPPPRPGPVLWSIAAGPLVNVILLPITIGLAVLSNSMGQGLSEDAQRHIQAIAWMNAGLLIFNILPIYPLDGGQILQSLLWFVIGRAKSLLVASIIGLVAGVGMIAFALWAQQEWFAVIAAFLVYRSWIGFQQARKLSQLLSLPRHEDAACPSCGESPPEADLWICRDCGANFDTFKHQAICPRCGASFSETTCPSCRWRHPIAHWFPSVQSAGSPYDDRM